VSPQSKSKGRRTAPPEPTADRVASKPSPGLHLVATPIGNAADITLRALETLAGVDAIACEDTRVTAKLLAIHGIRRPLLSYHEHNAEKMRPRLIQRLKDGESVALVSDAGTPLVSDPGYKLVRECRAEGLPVFALPGASSVLTALMLAGLPSDRFLFAGFLPNKSGPRRKVLAELGAVRSTLVLMEAPSRLPESLADMAEVLGDREAAVTRELTKLFEEVRRGSLAELAAHYAGAGPPKGEVTLVIGPPGETEPPAEDLDSRLRSAMAKLTVRDAADRVAAESGLPRRQVYARALELRNETP
jgi:16S rRNA (cytidine1402-2'-O)-methyltransferase